MFDGKYLEWNQRRIKCIIDFYGHKFMYKKKVLDLGCGQADISGALYRLGGEVTAVDARQEHLTTANKKFQGIKTVKADLERGWPFGNQKYDLVLDLGLLCHIRDFKQHLIDVCSSTNNLVLETAVCDSDDPDKIMTVEESKAIYDNSVNGIGCRPSAAAIEKVLSDCGMSFKRIDSARLNADPFVYDWQVRNTGDTSIYKRRFWFCNRTGIAATDFITSSPPTANPNPRGIFQAINRLAPIARPPRELQPRSTPPTTTPDYTVTINTPTSGNDDVATMSRKFAITPTNTINRYPNLKVLYLPIGDQPGMVDAWNNIGVQLKVFDFWTEWQHNGRNSPQVNKKFLDYVHEFQPKLIHMQLQMTGIITPESIMQAKKLVPGCIITNWSGDIRSHVIHDMNVMSRVIDCTLISSTGQLDFYKKAGTKNIKYWQVGYNPKVNYPKYENNFKYDVSFIANNYGNNFPDGHLRQQAVTKCSQAFGNKFGVFGNGWHTGKPCETRDVNNIYNNSVCALSISNFNSVSHYFSDRLLYCVASGRPTISWYFPGIESYFEQGKEIFIAKNMEDIVSIVNMCKNDPAKANAVGMAGAARAQAEHTFTSKVLELLHIVGLDK